MKNIQNRKSKGLSGSVLAAFVAAVLLLAGSTVSAEPGALAQSDNMQDQQDENIDKMNENRDKRLEERGERQNTREEAGGMMSEGENPFGGGPIEKTGKVKDYAKFVLDESTSYTVNGLKQFAKTSKDFIKPGDGEKELKQRHKDLEKAVSQISKADGPRLQAKLASEAFKDASQLFSDIQEKSYPESAQVVEPVKSAANKITGERSLAMQLGDVQNFFVESGIGFTKLAAGGTGEGIGGGPMDQPAKSTEPAKKEHMKNAPATPSDSTKPAHENDNMGGGPSNDGAAPSGY